MGLQDDGFDIEHRKNKRDERNNDRDQRFPGGHGAQYFENIRSKAYDTWANRNKAESWNDGTQVFHYAGDPGNLPYQRKYSTMDDYEDSRFTRTRGRRSAQSESR